MGWTKPRGKCMADTPVTSEPATAGGTAAAGVRSTEDIVALALVVIENWLLAHLLPSWVLPSEVQSAEQTLITVGVAWWLSRAAAKPLARPPVISDGPLPVDEESKPAP
jgi:hypothetical protein